MVDVDKLTETETDSGGHETERDILFMKGYTVFNTKQVDRLPAHYQRGYSTIALETAKRAAAHPAHSIALELRARQPCVGYGPDPVRIRFGYASPMRWTTVTDSLQVRLVSIESRRPAATVHDLTASIDESWMIAG